MENIIKYTLNCLNFFMISPLELRESGAWKHMLLLSESTVQFLQLLKEAGCVHQKNQ